MRLTGHKPDTADVSSTASTALLAVHSGPGPSRTNGRPMFIPVIFLLGAYLITHPITMVHVLL